MVNFPPRNFNCKDEELPVISRFVAFSVKRDLDDFLAYSPNLTRHMLVFSNPKLLKLPS